MPEKEKESNKTALKEKTEDISAKKEDRKETEAKKESEGKKETDSKKDSEDKKPSKTAIEDETQKILEMSEISLWLDNYDDIFSDFDPRPYSLRSLSDDFLSEAKKASRDKGENMLELRFLISENQRDSKIEATIKKRLRDHFTKHLIQLKKDLLKAKYQAILTGLLGVTLIFAASYLDALNLPSFVSRFLFVLSEPAGWFLTWFGLDKIFYSSELKKSEYKFYQKMIKCEIMFNSY